MSDDEKDIDSEPEVEDGQQSAMYKAKKFLASATVGTSAGRKVIVGFLGDEGEILLKALKHAAAKYAGKEKATELKENILKLAVKAKLAADEQRLTEKTTSHAVLPINSLCLQTVNHLRQPPGNVETQQLSGNINRIRDIILDIMHPHVQPKNYEKLQNIFKFLGDAKFLDAILNDPSYIEERTAIKENLQTVLAPLLATVEREQANAPCKVNNCKARRVEPAGNFKGSEYCARHHQAQYEKMLAKPVLEHFLDPADYPSSFFIQFLADPKRKDDNKADPAVDVAMYHFFDAVAKYKGIGRNLRKARAELIFSKYLKEQKGRRSVFVSSSSLNLAGGATPVPSSSSVDLLARNGKDLMVRLDENIVRKIQDDLFYTDAQSANLGTVFDEAQAVARARLDQCFEEYLKSPFFTQYIEALALPAAVVEQLAKETPAA